VRTLGLIAGLAAVTLVTGCQGGDNSAQTAPVAPPVSTAPPGSNGPAANPAKAGAGSAKGAMQGTVNPNVNPNPFGAKGGNG